jgi:hypothetical protein
MSRKLTIEQMRTIAKSRGGKCLSKKYVNSKTNLKWECAKGHRWEAKASQVKYEKTWCRECSGNKRLTINDIQNIAKSRGGICVSKKYKNAHTDLRWECSKGHHWKARPANVKNGTWCPKCAKENAGNSQRLTIEEMRALAKKRGGKCLSKTYRNAHTKLLWECANGHQWKARPANVKKVSWCPECSSGISERICRTYLRQIFGKPFPKSRPVWLKNSRGNQMELDGYCKSLNIAFEHQGEQHYTTDNRFIKSKESLQRRKRDDSDKQSLCQDNGIRLILIPQLFSRTQLEDLQRVIFNECQRLHIRRPAGMLDKKIGIKNAWKGTHNLKQLNRMHSIAKSRGGKCLSEEYVNDRTKLEWKCKKGHRWNTTPLSVKGGNWCGICSGKQKLTIEQMHSIAKSRGGKCLSKKYVTAKTKLQWQCAKGHRWKTDADSVKNSGTWCPECSGSKRLTIKDMQNIAKSRGGKCLSTKYVNQSRKLEWECALGHKWKKELKYIKYIGSWCPECRDK